MLILGAVETLQLIDGNRELPVYRFLTANKDERIALTAPGIIYAADVIAEISDAATRTRMENALDDFIMKSRESSSVGLSIPSPLYKLIPLGHNEIRTFPRIRKALDGLAAGNPGVLSMQILTIACIADIPLLLEKTPINEAIIDALMAAGIHLRIEWLK